MSDYYTQQTAALKTIIHDTCKIKAEQGVINSLKNDSGENYVTDTELSNNYLTKEVAKETYVNKEELENRPTSHLLGEQWISFDGTVPDGGVPFLGQYIDYNIYKNLYDWAVEHNRVITESEYEEYLSVNGGSCPYYSELTGNEMFRVPVFNGYLKASDTESGVAKYVAEGLPNITGTISSEVADTSSGAFVYLESKSGAGSANSSSVATEIIEFDASRSNPIYGNSVHVTPETNTILVGVWATSGGATVGDVSVDELADKIQDLKDQWKGSVAHVVGEQWITFDGTVPDGGVPFGGQLVSKAVYGALYDWVVANNRIIDEEDWEEIRIKNNGNVPYYSYGDGHSAIAQKFQIELGLDETYGLIISEITDSGITDLYPTIVFNTIVEEILDDGTVMGKAVQNEYTIDVTSLEGFVSSINENNEMPFTVETAQLESGNYLCTFIWKSAGKQKYYSGITFEYQPWSGSGAEVIPLPQPFSKIFKGGADAIEPTSFRMPKFKGYLKADFETPGQYVAEGLPNITGSFSKRRDNTAGTVPNISGSFTYANGTQNNSHFYATDSTSYGQIISFDASLSSPIYGNSEHVTPETNTVLVGAWAFNTYANQTDLELDDLRNALSVANTYDSMPLLMSHWDKKDFVSPGWVRADGYWLSGNLYIDAYNKIVEKKTKGDSDVIVATYVNGLEDASNPTCYLLDETNVAFRLPFVSSIPQIIAQEDEVIITADADVQWYKYYSDGHLEQGGEYYDNSTGDKTINFHIPFANTNYWISKQTGIDGNYENTMYQKYYNVFSLTTNSFNATTYKSAGGNKFRWFAKGEAAILPPSQWTENVGLYFKLGNTFTNADQMNATALSEKIDTVWNHWTNSDYVVETYKEGTSWYRKYKSGWIEQGGQIIGTTTGTQTITILPMADANYWVSIQRYGTAANTNNAALQYQQVINTTTTGFSAYLSTTSSTSTTTIRWMVSGYSA